jgi:hypothetical protein
MELEMAEDTEEISPEILLQLGRAHALGELLGWCNEWLTKAKDWRRTSFEDEWHDAQRDADAIYNPVEKAKKKSWQSCAFIPITPSHRETILAWLFRVFSGAKPPLKMVPRQELENDQSDNIQAFILREMEKSRFDLGNNAVIDDATTYGSGFARVRFEEKTEERVVRKPKYEELSVSEPSSILRRMMGNAEILGYEEETQQVVTYRGIRFEPLSIWDVFPDPSSLEIEKNPVAYRYKMKYGDIVSGVEEGFYFEEAADVLRNNVPPETNSPGVDEVKSDRKQDTGVAVERPDYSVEHEFYELFAPIPKKWVFLNNEDIDDPEKLIPARILFHKDVIVKVEPNESYSGEAPIHHCKYLHVNGQFYGRGIPFMLKDIQGVVNESVNQRIDANNLHLNEKIAVIEAAVLYPKEDLNEDIGGVVRLDYKKMRDMGMTHVSQAISKIELGSVDKAAFIDPQEMERYAQERTSANRVTIGTAGQVRDQNDTLGGMRMLREAAGDKFAYIGILMELQFYYKIYRALWELIYKNMTEEDIINTLGPEKAQTFELLSPEQIESDYIYQPQGIYTQENKLGLQVRLQSMLQQFGQEPWVDVQEFFDKGMQSIGEDPDNYKLPPDEMQNNIVAKSLLQQQQSQGPVEPPQGQPQSPGGQVGQ